MSSSSSYWSQAYSAGLQGNIYDPRFIQFAATLGYSLITYDDIRPDSDRLDYSLSMNFFPDLRLTWNVFARQEVQSIENQLLLEKYDITRTIYGGSVNFRGARPGNGNNRRNNYNNNNNNSGGLRLLSLPNVALSYVRQEIESLTPIRPAKETRDNTAGSIGFLIGPSLSLNVYGGREQFEDLTQANGSNRSYEIKTAGADANYRFSPGSEVRLEHTTEERTTQMGGFEPEIRTARSGLRGKSESRNSHSRYLYSYERTERETKSIEQQYDAGQVQLEYDLAEGFGLRGGLVYSNSEYTSSTEKTSLEEAGLKIGAYYTRQYRPEFMGPFGLDTTYGVSAGSSKFSSLTGTFLEASGLYYTNNLDISLNSIDWKQDNLQLSYGLLSKRDHSSVNNDMIEQRSSLQYTSHRIPRTLLEIRASYYQSDYNSDLIGLNLPLTATNQNQQKNGFLYQVTATHPLTWYLTLREGAGRDDYTTKQYSLSTLSSTTNTAQDRYFAELAVNYPITRNLVFFAKGREEYTKIDLAKDYRTDEIITRLSLGIRKILASIDYRWQQTTPENSDSYSTYSLIATLSRSF